MLTVSLTESIQLVRNVVERFPANHKGDSDDFGSCVYVKTPEAGGDPSPLDRLVPVCLIGHVFADLGILRAVLNDEGGQHGSCNFGVGNDGEHIFANTEKMGVTFTPEAQKFLATAQGNQDGGDVWPDALASAVTATLEAYEALADSQR